VESSSEWTRVPLSQRFVCSSLRPIRLLSVLLFVTKQIAISGSWPRFLGLLGYRAPFYARPFYPVSRPSPLPASPSTQVVLHAVRAMSLNGLDNPAVIDAYQSALADAGGW
jgi:hypothetical protein